MKTYPQPHKKLTDYSGKIMKKLEYIPLEIPTFNEMLDLTPNERIQCRHLFEEVAIFMRERCGLFDIHIAYYTLSKLKENVVESMKLNLDMIQKEMNKREYEKKEKDE